MAETTTLHRDAPPEAEDAALALALAAMRRESLGDQTVRARWAELMACRDHSSPRSQINQYFRPSDGCGPLRRGAARLRPAEEAALAAPRAMLSYWARMAGGFVPSKRHCDPVVDRPLLTPWLFLGDLQDEEHFSIRLAGMELTRFAGMGLKGQAGEAILVEAPRALAAATRLLIRGKAPSLIRGEADFCDGRIRRFEYALAPLATDYGEVRYLLGALGIDGVALPKLHAQF